MVRDQGRPGDDLRKAREDFDADPNKTTTFDVLSLTDFKQQIVPHTEWLVTYYNYKFSRQNLQTLKRRTGFLSPGIEAHLIELHQHFAEATKSMLSAADSVAKTLASTKADQFIDKHKLALFCLTPENPSTAPLRRTLVGLGASEPECDHYLDWLKAHKWDPLSLPGSDGTYSGAVASARTHLPDIERDIETERQHGLPVLEGSDPATAGAAVFIVVVIVAIAVCSHVKGCSVDIQ